MTSPPPSENASSLKRRLQIEPTLLAPMISLAVMVVFFLAVSSGFRRLSTITLVLDEASVLAIVAVGLTFVLLCAEIDLAVGFIALWTATLCGWIFESWDWVLQSLFGVVPSADAPAPAWVITLAIALPLLTSVLLGLISGAVTIMSRLPSFIITLAMMNIALGMSKYLAQGRTLPIPGLLQTIGNRGIRGVGFDLGFEIPYKALIAAVVLLVGHVVAQHTRFGRYVYMTGGNREAARLAGVRTGRVVVACLAISALTAGIGGLLSAGKLAGVNATMNADLLLSAVACVVLGGTSLFGGEGGIGRTVIGVLIFSVLSVGLNKVDWIDDQARTLLTGVVLLLALVINGLLGRRK